MTTISPNPIELNSEVSIPSPQKVEKSRKVISSMVATGQLTPAGEAWLKVSSDPWHDTKIQGFRGVPDNYTGQSVTMSINQEMSIKKPTGFIAGNWNVRIATHPLASSVRTNEFFRVGNAAVISDLDPYPQGVIYPVQVDFSSADSNFSEFLDGFTTGLQIPIDFLKGPYRVCGMGVEVINTTATLQKQGLATCAVMNQSTSKNFTLTTYLNSSSPATNYPTSSATFYPVKTPPVNLSEMMILPGTTQWEASEGAYSVVQLLSLDCTPPNAVPEYPMFMSKDFDAAYLQPLVPADLATNPVRIPHAEQGIVPGGAPTLAVPYFPKVPGHVPMNTTVHMYTGLSDQTTLTLRVRWIIERFPNDNEPEIVVLTQPSASWDPTAIEIHSRLMSMLVPAVMFKENPKGEWWKSMLAGIADIAGSGLMMMPHPLAKGAGAAIMAGRAALAPDVPVKFKTTKTKNQVPPAQRPQPRKKKPVDKKKKKKKKPASAA